MTPARWLDTRADEMAELVERLVAVDTENPPGRGLRECAALLRDAMDELGLAPEVIELPPVDSLEDEPRIVRGTAGDGPRIVYFHGHFDVVPAQRRDQFQPQRGDGRVVGRGSADMKGGLVSMLYGAAAARELGGLDDRRVVLHLVCDEETGSAVGSGHLRDAGLIDPEAVAMLTAEPTGGVVWHASRGAITLRVEVSGREAHVGQADLGINAFDQMVRVAGPLADLSRELLETRRSMLVVGGAAGAGANFNVVPGSAWFSVDRRFNPDEELDEELARLTGTIERAARAAGAEVVDRDPPAPALRGHRPGPSGRADAVALHRGGGGLGGPARGLPGVARHPLVRPARHPGLRVRAGAPRRLARPRRVHRGSRDAPLRRGLRPLRELRRNSQLTPRLL